MTTPSGAKRRFQLIAKLLDSEDDEPVVIGRHSGPKSSSFRGIEFTDGSDACGPASGKASTEYEIEIDSSYDSEQLDALLKRLRTPKTSKVKSVTEPLGVIVLSSDSDDEVFSTPKERKVVRRTRASSTKSEVPRTPVHQAGASKRIPMTEVRAAKKCPLAEPLRKSPRLLPPQGSSEEFLYSLSNTTGLEQCTPEVQRYHKNFAAHREELTAKLLRIYNEEVFARKLPEDLKVEWNVRLTRTAGLCIYSKKEKSCRLQMSCKVVDRPDRLRDTLLHELCHAATWILHGQRGGHGHLFRFWADCAGRRFPRLPPVTRCHSYVVRTRFIYSCQGCGGCVRRHSKSVDTSRKVCSRCGGRFVLIQSSSPR